MTRQHAQAAICDYYDFENVTWHTPASSYARGYYEWRVGERRKEPRVPRGLSGCASDTADQTSAGRIRRRIDAELDRAVA
jgi:hypothetical protein